MPCCHLMCIQCQSARARRHIGRQLPCALLLTSLAAELASQHGYCAYGAACVAIAVSKSVCCVVAGAVLGGCGGLWAPALLAAAVVFFLVVGDLYGDL